jgi:uncharacterized protein YndB with AHSA1/START domain
MPDILHEVTIAGTPDKVFKALTEQQGLASWWTTRAMAEPRVGSVSEFGFEGGKFVIKMEIDKLDAGHSVAWNVRQAGAPDWGGTHVTWDLTPVENGTKVLLGHRDFVSTDGSFANTSYHWALYLASLKAFVETGLGTPHAT